jgi:hypothetical protein
MIKLTHENLDVIEPLIKERIEGSFIGTRCPIDFIFPVLIMNVIGERMIAYADKEEDPSAAMLLTFAQAAYTKETAVIMNLIYVSNRVREESPRLAIELTNEMFATAEAFAKSKNADVLQAASWIYRGSPDISSLLKSKGFEPQTIEHVKILNPANQ